MALTQRQLKEVAEEALQAQRAYDELSRAVSEAIAHSEIEPAARLVLLSYILRDQPVLSASRAEAALEHIQRTSKRNAKRAREACEARKGRS